MNNNQVQSERMQLWINGICMTTIERSKAQELVNHYNNNGGYASMGSDHIDAYKKKPVCLMTEEEKKQVRKEKGKTIKCSHCGHNNRQPIERCRKCENYVNGFEGGY
jgi:primosomal protein N'